MARKREKLKPNAKIILSRAVSVDAAWAAFRAEYADWLRQVESPEPLYCLPRAAINALVEGARSGRPILDKSSARAEHAFRRRCRLCNAVGFWNGQAIVYPLLGRPAPLPGQQLMKIAGWSLEEMHQAQGLVKQTADAPQRLRGYVGWLLTEPAYLTEAQALAARWQALPDHACPTFPLGRVAKLLSAPSGAMPASEERVTFETDFGKFCDRWGLIKLASWDLPEPQGPLLPSPLPAGAAAMPAAGVHIILPLHYPLQGDDALQRRVVQEQRSRAAAQDLDPSMAGLAHHKPYAQIFQVIHLEHVITSRYRRGGRPKGFITQMEMAIALAQGCGLDQIKKLRKAISLCRRGQRAKVNWLLPPNR
jgi:hypothetical protein